MIAANGTIISKHQPCLFQPTRDNVLIEELSEQNKMFGSIALPDDCEMPRQGRVVAVGPGLWSNGKYEPMEYKVGDIILMFADQPFTCFPVGRQDYHIIRQVYLKGKLITNGGSN